MTFRYAVTAVCLLLFVSSAEAGDRQWSPIQPTGGLTRGFVEIDDALWMYSIGAVHESADAGETWTVQPQVPEGRALVVSPHDSSVIYRPASSKIHRSTDGGAT